MPQSLCNMARTARGVTFTLLSPLREHMTVKGGGEIFGAAIRHLQAVLCTVVVVGGICGVEVAECEMTGLLKIAAGGNHTCAVTTAGGAKCWGRNSEGQLGDGSTADRTTPVHVSGLTSGVSSISGGEYHTCAVITSGGAKCWGKNQDGQLGDWSTTNRATPVNVSGLTSGVSSISGGGSHTCAVTTSGGAKCWGRNQYGRLGDGSTTNRTTAVNVSGLTSGVSSISSAEGHTCAVTTSGGAKCWGYNGDGQLGDGTTTQRLTAINVSGLTSGVSSVSTVRSHTCAVTTSGGAKCWGYNFYGQLGDGSITNRTSPIDVTGLTSGVSSIANGWYHTCAATTSGGIKCWGYNGDGQLGDGSRTNRTTAVDVSGIVSGVSNVSSGQVHTCAVTTAGKANCWGANSYGQCGDGSTTSRTTAIGVTGLITVAGSVSGGENHTCGVTTAGGAKCWGLNDLGGIGDGSLTDRHSAVDVAGLISGVSRISSGKSHTCAVTTSGGAKCWGWGYNGQLGYGSTLNRTTEVDVSSLTSGVSSLSTGSEHTCAVTTSGGAKCWGRNNYGQLGDGTTVTKTIAVDVSTLTSGVSMISGGVSHTCAVTTSGGAKCWGYNFKGQLGDGSQTNATIAVDVSGLTSGVTSISGGEDHTCAVTTSGGVKCWGTGWLGDGTTTTRTTAVDVVDLSSGVSSVSSGQYHTCAVTTAGGARCWGKNYYGQIGDGSTANRLSPVNVFGLSSGVIGLSSGYNHTCAVTTSGGAMCWGSNYGGQLGEGDPYIHTVLNGFTAQGIVTLIGSPLTGVVFRTSGMGPLYTTQESTADGSGAYLLPIVETASYTITPELAGYYFTPTSVTGTMAADLTQDFVATLITYNITGTVTANGSPLSGASVDGGALGIATTDASGVYAFNTVTPGTAYTLTVSHGGVTFGVDTASGSLNSNATHDFSGMLNTYDITGTVTVGGNPFPGVAVNGGGLGNITTDGSGGYSFTGVNYGTVYVITPSLTDYDFTPTSAGATLTGNVTHDFTAVYSPPTTPSTSSGLTTTTTVATTSVATTTAPVTTAPTTTLITTTVAASTTAETTSLSSIPTTSSMQTTSLVISTSTVVSATTTSLATTTVESTTTIATVTTIPIEDSDGDGLTDTEEDTLGLDPEVADSDGDGVTDGEEVTTGTNPKDPGSKAPKLRTTICSDWNGYLGGTTGRGMYNIMEHINLTAKKLRVKTELRSIRGHLKDTYEFFLRGNQQFDLLVHDMAGRETNSYGQVCTTYERAPAGSLDGRMVYYKYGTTADGGNGIQFAFALPFENPSRGTTALLFNTMQPSLDPKDSGNLVANWVQLSNVSRKRLKGALTFYSLTGAKLGGYSVNLRDGARYDHPGHAWGGQAGLARFVPEDSTVDYQLRAIRYFYDNTSGLDSFTSAYPFSAAVGSGEVLMAPVDTGATSDGSTSAVLEVANTLGKKVSVTLKLYDNTGKTLLYGKAYSLKAYSSLHLPLDAVLNNSTGLISTGLLTAKSSHAGSVIGTVVHYGRTSSGGVKNLYAVPLREPVGTILKGSYNTYLNQGCTLYIGNSATSKEKVTVGLRGNDGISPVKDYALAVPGRGLLAEDLCDKSPENVYGVVTVSAAKPKRIAAILVREGKGDRYKMATDLR